MARLANLHGDPTTGLLLIECCTGAGGFYANQPPTPQPLSEKRQAPTAGQFPEFTEHPSEPTRGGETRVLR